MTTRKALEDGLAKTHAITLIPVDGIGPEVTGATVRILEAAGKKTGVSFDWRSHDAGGRRVCADRGVHLAGAV